MRKSSSVVLTLTAVVVHGFVTPQPNFRSSRLASSNADALTDYMVKAHEEKLRAVRDIEEKKNSEIEALKKEIDSLQKGGGALAAPTAATLKGSKEELAAKVIAYQNFMAKYIVEAQEQKVQAVLAAENAAKKKYEEKLLLLGGGASGATSSAAPVPSSPAAVSKKQQLYMDRNAKVSAAAAAGKSRWGDKEVERVSKIQTTTTTTPVVNVGASLVPEAVNGAVVVPVPPEVEAADHGLRADGSVGGLTLAERVAMGATAAGAAAAAPMTPAAQGNTLLYHGRNNMVAAAVAAGKPTRWGDMEVQRAIKLAAEGPVPTATAAIPVTSEVKAADHGLRSDGSVGGPSLADRVNLGAQLLGR